MVLMYNERSYTGVANYNGKVKTHKVETIRSEVSPCKEENILSNFVSVKEFPGYVINEQGVVIGLKGHPLTHLPNVDGYPVVYMRRNGKNHCKRVHRLLAQAFIPNPNNFPVVNHKDGNKENFSLDNLEWTTIQGNCEHAAKVLKVVKGNRSIDEVTAIDICKLMEQGLSNEQIKEELQVSIDVISKIRSGKSWTEVSSSFNIRPRVGKMLISHIKLICEKLNQGMTIQEIVDLIEDRYVTKDSVSKISSFKTYTEITENILLPREKRSSTSRKA